MKAIIETGGKQYYVSEGATIYVEKLEGNEGDKVVFDKVLMANGVEVILMLKLLLKVLS